MLYYGKLYGIADSLYETALDCVLPCCTVPCYTMLYVLYAMLYYTLLYSLYYAILHYSVLYTILLYHTILCCMVLYYTVLYCTILYYTILYYTILHYTTLYYTIIYYTILYTLLYYILYYTILYYTILYYTIPYHTVLYSTVLFYAAQNFLSSTSDYIVTILLYLIIQTYILFPALRCATSVSQGSHSRRRRMLQKIVMFHARRQLHMFPTSWCKPTFFFARTRRSCRQVHKTIVFPVTTLRKNRQLLTWHRS